MAIFKCKLCGGNIEFEPGATVGVCDSCGTRQTLPRLDDERRANLYDRANHFRRNNDYDKAAALYEQILNEDDSDAEAYWSLVLCRYGIEYVEDPATKKRLPTINRAQFTSVLVDENYKCALQYADAAQRELYEAEAHAIDEIQKGILAISQKEEPFDVFICYKETDENGRRTQDSVLAQDLYYQLKQAGFKVFFSRITLEDKLGSAYEPYIFAALNSAKVMVVLGTRPEHFNAVWVKNEWSRFLAQIKNGADKTLIPAYRDMDPYDLPEAFSHLQAQDMSKLGFVQDLVRGIGKIAKADKPRAAVKETIVVNNGGSASVAPLLKRAFLSLEDGEWDKADGFCEQVLNQEPENAEAYLCKLMAELHVRRRGDLADCERPFDNDPNFQKAVRFGDQTLQAELNGYITRIKDRAYEHAVKAMSEAKTETTFQVAAEAFRTISGFKDADALAKECRQKAVFCRQNTVYANAVKTMETAKTGAALKEAAKTFQTIPSFKDADALAKRCLKEAAKRKQKRNKALLIAVCSIVSLAVIFLVLWFATPAWTLHYEENETGYTVTCNKEFVKTVNIPAEHSGKPVTSIGDWAFENCKGLTNVAIPDSVTSIGYQAFHNCTGLKSIIIPDSVTSIGEKVFSGCSSLESMTIPFVGNRAGVTANDIDRYPFGYLFGTGSYTGGTTVTQYYYGSRTTYYIPSTLRSVTVTGGNILYGAFHNCTMLTNITIPDSVTDIAGYAFCGCTSLASITISESVTSIGHDAFNGCTGLTSVTIPDSVTSIGYDAFNGCTSLASIIFNGTKTQWAVIDQQYDWDYNTGDYTIHCTDGDIK